MHIGQPLLQAFSDIYQGSPYFLARILVWFHTYLLSSKLLIFSNELNFPSENWVEPDDKMQYEVNGNVTQSVLFLESFFLYFDWIHSFLIFVCLKWSELFLGDEYKPWDLQMADWGNSCWKCLSLPVQHRAKSSVSISTLCTKVQLWDLISLTFYLSYLSHLEL